MTGESDVNTCRYATAVAALLLACATASAAGTLASEYPKAEEGFEIIEKSPLLKDIILDEQFFDKLDEDEQFVDQVKAKLASQAYRSFGPAPSVRVTVRRGTLAEYPYIILEYQTSFKNLMYFGGGPFFGHCVYTGGGRDAPANRTFYGGCEDPNGRKAFDTLAEKRLSLPSNKRNAETEAEFQALFSKYLPTMPIGKVHDAVRGDMESLIKAFDYYGSKTMRNPTMGSFGIKLMDKVYVHIRTFGTADGFSGEPVSGDVSPNPYFWLIIGGGQRSLPRVQLPAFPGAEGMGAMTTGGRGGKVIYVTTLEPTGPGSLYEALNTKGPRTVLFKVSGQIMLPDETWIKEPDMTLIGYTAPGEGVEVCGRLCMAADNIIMRGMRWRLRPPISADGMDTTGELHNIIFDHCSFAYASDELIRFIGEGHTFINYSIQHCILGPNMGGLGSHPYGPEIGGVGSIHHNILYNAFSRSPEADCDLIDWRNNIMYNLRSGHSKRLPNKFNMVNNLIIDRPGGSYKYSFNSAPNNYISGNMRDTGGELTEFDPGDHGYVKAPYSVIPVTTYDAKDLEAKVLPNVGASLPCYDATDKHWLEGLKKRTGKPGFWTNPTGGWKSYNPGSNDMDNYEEWTSDMYPPPAAGAKPLIDTDGDGMPDDWEKANKLDPKDASDGTKDNDKDGYTNLEEFLYGTKPNEFVDYRIPRNNTDAVFE
jgi:pectate lyase